MSSVHARLGEFTDRARAGEARVAARVGGAGADQQERERPPSLESSTRESKSRGKTMRGSIHHSKVHRCYRARCVMGAHAA